MAEVHRLRNAIQEAREDVARAERVLAEFDSRTTLGMEMHEELQHEKYGKEIKRRLEAARKHLKTAEGAMAYAATTSTRIRIDVLEMALMERAEPIQLAGASVEAGISRLLDALAVFNHQQSVINDLLVEYKTLTRPAIELSQLEHGLSGNVQNMTTQLVGALKKAGLIQSIKTVSI